MQVITDLNEMAPYRGGVVSIGNFDGVHRGHQAMLSTLVEQAKKADVQSIAMTFDPPPVALISPSRVPPRLSRLERKAELMERVGIDCLLVYPTTREFLQRTPDEFFQVIVLDQLQASGLVEGPNFFFGKNRQGNVEVLQEMTARHGLSFQVVGAVEHENEVISSSRIRAAIQQGNLQEAVGCLGHPYQLTGQIAGGAQRGRDLGFPTANMEQIETLIPAAGVYAGSALVDSMRYPVAIHIGANLTFSETERKVEAHLIGFNGDLYGRELSVDLSDRIREIQKFDDPESLRLQLNRDIEKAVQVYEQLS